MSVTLEQLYKEAESAIQSAANEQQCVRIIKEYKDRASAAYGDRQLIAQMGQKALEKFNDPTARDTSYKPPTPPVGYAVNWMEKGKKENPVAAIVTKTLQPGKVNLTLFPDNGSLQRVYIRNVYHAGDPRHEIPGNPSTVKDGSWEYLPGVRIPKSHYDLYDAVNKRIEAQTRAQQERVQEQIALEQARIANRKAAVTEDNVQAGEEYQEPGNV
jgi:hypothetical protein